MIISTIMAHDIDYKLLLSKPEIARYVIEGFIEDVWRGPLDLNTIERISLTHARNDTSELSSVIWKAKAGESDLYLYFLIESFPDPWMSVRVMTNVAFFYMDLINSGKIEGNRIPFVLPVVFYIGKDDWTEATNVAELLPKDLPPSISKCLPRVEYVLIDQVDIDVDSGVFTMRLRNAPDVGTLLAEWMQNYLLHEFLPELNLPRSASLDELITLLPERFSSWQQKIEQEAREAALLKRKQEGMSEGGIRLLQRQLARRFGPLPEWARQRLQDATPEALETWADRVLDAQRLEDVFAP